MDPWTVAGILGGPLIWAISVWIAFGLGKDTLQDDLRRFEDKIDRAEKDRDAALKAAEASERRRVEQCGRYLEWAATQAKDAAAMAAIERDLAGLDDDALFLRMREQADADTGLAPTPREQGAGCNGERPPEVEG